MKQTTLETKDLDAFQSTLKSRMSELDGRKVAIIGDIGLDEYVLGDVRRISPEAPVPVLEVEQEDQRLGLAANVAQNIASLGGTPVLFSVVGEDRSREQLSEMLKAACVSTDWLVADSERPTTRKLRVMAEHHHLVRVDYEKKKYLSEKVESQLLKNFESELPGLDAVIIEDYAKGVLSENVCQQVIQKSRAAGKKVMVDPHPGTPPAFYKGATIMTPNKDEAFRLSGLNLDDLRETEDSLLKVGEALLELIQSEEIIITRGKQGMTIFEKGEAIHLPTVAKQVFDVTGAGDTVIAALALAWASGWSLVDSCSLANLAAGVVVSKVGCVPCYRDDLV